MSTGEVTKVVIKEFFHQATDLRVTLSQGFEGDEPVFYAVTTRPGDSKKPYLSSPITNLCISGRLGNYAQANECFREIVRTML